MIYAHRVVVERSCFWRVHRAVLRGTKLERFGGSILFEYVIDIEPRAGTDGLRARYESLWCVGREVWESCVLEGNTKRSIYGLVESMR